MQILQRVCDQLYAEKNERRSIGADQGIKHKLADIYTRNEMARARGPSRVFRTRPWMTGWLPASNGMQTSGFR